MRQLLLASSPAMLWVITGIHVLFLVLSGFLMFAFSALGPASGNFDLIFYISMYGEVLMALFFYLYGRKKDVMSGFSVYK